MNDERLKRALEKAFPQTPDVFHDRMTEIAQEAKQKKVSSHRRLLARTLLICALTLIAGGAAVAAMNHYGVLNFNSGWEEDYYFSLPEAKDMIHYDLVQARTGNILWKVKEAVYDGRVLRLLYSAQDLTETHPFPSTGDDYGLDEVERYYFAMGKREGVFLKADGNGEIIVNGVGVNLQSVDMRFSKEPGEIEFWVDCRMDYYDPQRKEYVRITPEGVISVSMPFSFQENNVPEDAPEALSFQMDVGDAASRYALKLPDPVTLENGSVIHFTDLHFSPATIFLDFHLTIPAERAGKLPPEDDYEVFERALAQFEEYGALWDLRLENLKGEQLGRSKDGSMGWHANDDGSFTFERHYESTPSDKYTETIYLCLGQWKLPIPMIYQTQE